MIIDWTSGAIQQLPTGLGQNVWTWSGEAGEVVAVGPSYIFTAQARSKTDTAAARSTAHAASARSTVDAADEANRVNQ